MNNKHADMETAADIMNDDTTDKIAMLNEMHPMVHMMASVHYLKNADFNSDANFNHFVRRISKTRFSINMIKTAVHMAENIVLCGRHRISHIFINAKICSIVPLTRIETI